jgi:NAD+ synthase (glutamine-hydrolysing)
MPYDVLDLIEGLAIRDKRSPRETLEIMRELRPKLPAKQLTLWTVKFFRMWCRNQWKRERYAPSFHLDDKNLDPKSWCRFPILSSGFEEELSAILAEAKG